MHVLKQAELAFKQNRKAASAVAGGIGGGFYFVVRYLIEAGSRHPQAAAALGWALIIGGLAAGVLVFSYGFSVWREKRTIENIPTSKVRSLAMGLVELCGHAQPKALLKSPVTGTKCVYYKFLIEKRVRTSKGTKWVVLNQGASTNYFYVDDGTGRILVDPVEADIHLARDYRYTGASLSGAGFMSSSSLFTGDDHRYTEWYIVPDDQVYVLGTVTKWKNALDDRRLKIAERLRQLKDDRARMRAFDRDGDGQVDATEWELARQRIEQDVLAEELANPADTRDDSVVTRDPLQPLMIISDCSERELVRKQAIKAWLLLLGGAGLIIGAAFMMLRKL